MDTTAAGDTFTGYFLHAVLEGKDVAFALKEAACAFALKEAACASAITVSRPGAAQSIPLLKEVRG